MKKIFIIIAVIVISLLFIFITGHLRDKSQSLKKRLEEAEIVVKNGDLDKAEELYKSIIGDFKNKQGVVEAISELADLYRLQNQLLKAKKLYMDIINQFPESEIISEIQKKLWDLNIEIIFSGLITEGSQVYEVKPQDTLSKIANKYHTTVSLIKESNDLETNTIRPNDRLKIITATFSIVVDKSQNTLTLKMDDKIVKIYRVSTGKNNCTPTGEFTIVNKLKDPVWYKTGAIVPAESPENILGTRWMGLSKKGYGIHGTTDPESIGKQITEGCIRMSNEDIEELFKIVPRGTKVTIVD